MLRHLRHVPLLLALLPAQAAHAASHEGPSTRRADRARLDAERRAADARLPAPSDSELGWYGLSVGWATVGAKTAVGSAEPSELPEGASEGGGTYGLHYEKQLLHCLGARGFMQRAGWQTELAEHAGDGERVLYDLGAGPVCSFAAKKGRYGLSLYAFVPVSFSWSVTPTRSPRAVVLESTNVGTGYRVGLGLGMLIRFSTGVGMMLEAGGAFQHVEHVRRYRHVDGSGEVELPIGYDLQSFGLKVGLAFMP